MEVEKAVGTIVEKAEKAASEAVKTGEKVTGDVATEIKKVC